MNPDLKVGDDDRRRHVQVGVCSFVDKPFAPYGIPGDHVFNIEQSLTADNVRVS